MATSGDGGGMFIFTGSPTVTNCTFTDNFGSEDSGGMGIYSASPTVTHCTFNGNMTWDLGGGMSIRSSSPTVSNCTFDGNTGCSGGGVFFYDNSALNRRVVRMSLCPASSWTTCIGIDRDRFVQ